MHSINPQGTPQFGYGPLAGEGDELVRRLRGLKWTEVDPQLRFRCWEEFSQKLAERAAFNEAPSTASGESREVYEFSRGDRARRTTGELRLPNILRRVAQGPGGRLDLARPSLARRPGLSLASARLI